MHNKPRLLLLFRIYNRLSRCVQLLRMHKRRTTARVGVVLLAAGALWLHATRTPTESLPRLEPSIVENVRRHAGHVLLSTETAAPHPGTTIAICTLTKSRPSWKSLADTTLQKLLIPSIEHTVSEDERSVYSIELHIGADHDDNFWIKHHNSLQHPPWLNLRFYFYTKTRQFRLPFNNLTDDAYANGADYLVRINDDTEFVTNGWVAKGVAALRGMRPPNVGVIGPHFNEGNTDILTHDMVHRTHIDIFGTYYPSVFHNWYVDDWITRVYGNDRTLKLDGWRVKHHTTAHGQRYVQSGHQHQHLEDELKTGAAKIDAWLSSPKQQSERQQTYPPAPQFTILYAGELWHTPSACSIVPVADATILPPNGQVRNKTGVYGFGKWYWEQKHLGVSAPRLLDGPLLTLVQVWNNNFQHIVFDTVPKLAFVCPFLRERRQVRVLVMNILQRDLVIEACPISEARFVVFENAIRAPVVYVPHFVGSDLKMGLVPPNSVPSLGLKTAQGSDVVYLARKAGATRSVANEAAVLATLREKWPDLRVVFPSNDWRKDRESVRTASVIIGPHGGALANMIFAPANTTIIEFTPLVQYKRDGKNERPRYFGLAHGLGFKYHAVEPSTFDFDSGSMMVPTDRLANAIESVGLSAGRSLVTRPPPGTQMGPEQIASIKRALGPKGNLLVWGLGNDSPFWNDATTGRVAFIEDDIPDAKAGTQWYNVITRKYPFLEAYKVHYHTDTVNSFPEYIDSPRRWHELELADLPSSIRNERWDVILVDAPLGCCNAGPGRYQSIYETWRLAKQTAHVFVDDYERKVEREFSQAVFGRAPDSVVKRKRAASNENEQAHFEPRLRAVIDKAVRHHQGNPPEPEVNTGADKVGAWLSYSKQLAEQQQAQRIVPQRFKSVDDRISAFRRGAVTPLASAYQPLTRVLVHKCRVEGLDPWRYMIRRAIGLPTTCKWNRTVLLTFTNGDWPVYPRRIGETQIDAEPIFSPQTSENFHDIAFPTHTRARFGENFDSVRRGVLDRGSQTRWQDRRSVAIWRGAHGGSVGCGKLGAWYFPDNHRDHCDDEDSLKRASSPDVNGYTFGLERHDWYRHPRVRLVMMATAHGFCGGKVDAGFTSRKSVTSHAQMKQAVPFETFAEYRYVIHVGNNGFSDSLWMKLGLGSVVLYAENEMHEWFEAWLVPGVHYVRIKEDFSDLCQHVERLDRDTLMASRIAQAGQAFVRNILTPNFVNQYVLRVLDLASEQKMKSEKATQNTPCTHIVTDSGAGLFSNVMGVLVALSRYGTNIQVQWSNAMYLAPKSNNVWTQYFEPISSCIVYSSTKRIQMAGWDHGFVDPEASLAPMTRHIRLNSNMNALFEDYWTWHGEPSLGVHIRSTDRKTDAAKNLFVLPTLRYIQQIQRCLDKDPNIKTIFVASDTQVTLDALKNYFGAKIKSLDVVRSTDTRPIHHGHLDAPFNTGKSAVLDAWLLATTDFKVLSTSQLSAYAVLKQGPNTPFFNLNEEDGYKRLRKMFPSRPDSVTGWFPGLHQLTELRPSPDWTILLTVNDGFYDFFENWWTFFRRLEAVHRVVVVAEDDVAYAKLQTKTGLAVERSHLTQVGAHAYDSKSYKEMVSTRAGHILRHLRAGENVVYTDVDTVWLSDPTDYLTQGVDIVAQVDGQSYEGISPYYCTGFMGIRSNKRSIQMIERWGIQLAKTPQLNQPVFNRALRQTGGVRHLGLSNALFPNGDQYFRLMDDNKKRAVVVVHNNYIVGHDAKKKRFQDNGLWRSPNYKSR